LHPAATEEFAERVLTKRGEWKKRPPAPSELVGNEPLRTALAALLALPPAHYTDGQWEALGAIVALLPRAAAELKVVFGTRGHADFTEIAQGAVRALGTPDAPTDLLLALDARIRHLLVDEFQDTSISQRELLERLTAGWEAGDGRTVFAVGDPMQSIYRFREAEVGIFLRARQRGIGNVKLEPLALHTNFRSQAGIVEWANTAFTSILPQAEDETAGAIPYSSAVAHHARTPGDAVRWHGFFDDDKVVARTAEAQCVVEIIAARRGERPGAKIAILVRNRGCLEHIVPAIKQAHLRFRAIEIDQLGEKQVVQDLLALTRVLLHPADRIAWLALLRAPWCGLGLDDLAQLAEEAAGRTVWELMHDATRVATLSGAGRALLMHLREVLARALAQRLRGGLRARVEGVWLALGGPACVGDATDLEDAAMFLDHLAAHEEAGDLPDLAAFEESLGRLYALPDVDAGDDAIEIMTIHKAKGLEFDTVIVPGLDRLSGRSDAPLLIWKERPDATLLLAPIKESGEKKEPIYDYLRTLERTAEDHEAGRLLYVAVTRAQLRLHLLAHVGTEEGTVTPPAKYSLLAKAWPVAEKEFSEQLRQRVPVVTPAASMAGERAGCEQKLLRLAADWELPQPPLPVRRRAQCTERDADNGIEFSWAGETARHVGSVVHRWLQRIADDELKEWDAARVASLRPVILQELATRGVANGEMPPAAERVATALQRAVTDERGRWLLGPQRNARNEHRITAVIGGEYVNLVIDRMFEDADGRRWIVDYKTSGHEGANVEGFLDRERTRYEAQLARYATAIGVRAKLGLYFPLLAGWREWE
jgi:ATP-dependent exoDNAse (exonuclease V) beta subunit